MGLILSIIKTREFWCKSVYWVSVVLLGTDVALGVEVTYADWV
jgi:hypothetical protein